MTILELAESFKTMNRPNPAQPFRSFTAYLSEIMHDRNVKFDTTFIQVFNLCYTKLG